LTPLASHADEEVRRRAVIALGERGEAAAVEAALSDPAASARAGAAFAAGRFGLPVAGMAARVADADEDWAVREQAYLALAGRPTDEATYAILAAFKLQREAVGEGSFR
jgi:HEAT repeat protein